jgi:hypothetical protein
MVTVNYFKLDNRIYEGTKHVFTIILNNTNASFDDINGFDYKGTITFIKTSNNFSLDKLKPNNEIVVGKRINIYDIEFLKQNKLGIKFSDIAVINDYKILLNKLIKMLNFSEYREQPQALFFNCKIPTTLAVGWAEATDKDGKIYYYNKKTRDTQWDRPVAVRDIFPQASQYYKIHISINIQFIFTVIVKLSKILCKYTDLFNEGKIIMPFFGQYYDITDKKALKYLQWNSGSSVANIVLYPLKKYDDNPLLFQTRLIDFVIEWSRENDKFGRQENNLYFNERITKSLYIAYGSDSSSKSDEIESGVVKNYKSSNNLKKEKKKLCTMEGMSKVNVLNDCLLNKYNISYSQLCSDKLSAKNAWVRKEMPHKNEITFDDECYKKL